MYNLKITKKDGTSDTFDLETIEEVQTEIDKAKQRPESLDYIYSKDGTLISRGRARLSYLI